MLARHGWSWWEPPPGELTPRFGARTNRRLEGELGLCEAGGRLILTGS